MDQFCPLITERQEPLHSRDAVGILEGGLWEIMSVGLKGGQLSGTWEPLRAIW